MKKIKLFDKVNVYQNGLGNTEKYIHLLKDSEFNLGGKYYFSEWKDWYSIGTMMNIPMPHKNFNVVEEYPNIDHAIKQKEFIDHISNCFYTFTEDYIKEYNVELSKWSHSGISICRYDETKNTDYLLQLQTQKALINKAILLFGGRANYLETFQAIQISPPIIITLWTLVPPRNLGELMLNKSFISVFLLF